MQPINGHVRKTGPIIVSLKLTNYSFHVSTFQISKLSVKTSSHRKITIALNLHHTPQNPLFIKVPPHPIPSPLNSFNLLPSFEFSNLFLHPQKSANNPSQFPHHISLKLTSPPSTPPTSKPPQKAAKHKTPAPNTSLLR
jgi:hypothetical protein